MPTINQDQISARVLSTVQQTITTITQPKRRALSIRYPVLRHPLLLSRQSVRSVKNLFNPSLADDVQRTALPRIVARHQSLLLRQLGDTDMRLQHQKVTNIKRAVQDLNGIVIHPGETFSLWHILGRPVEWRGYVPGMLLANGKIVEGVGGGLCQLSNFLCWLLLHGPFEIVERYHHSLDVFPDSGRTLPFGSGATIMYNLVDLRLRNTSNTDIQLWLWLTDKHLKGQLRSAEVLPYKYKLTEREHYFIEHDEQYYRYNQIWRTQYVAGEPKAEELVFTNCAPVMYEVDETVLDTLGYNLTHVTLPSRL